MPLPTDIIKMMPPRGPLQQYRLASRSTFTCSRCGGSTVSRLITTVDGDPDRLLCNGCYGWLLSLWKIKAGNLPDADRDAAILSLLDRTVTREQVADAQARLAERVAHRSLSPVTQQMLATAEAVTGALRTATGLDWSAAVIGLCKAVEIEVLRRVVEPLAQLAQGRDLTSDLADRDLARLARYCAGRAPAPELGSLSYTLTVAARSERRRVTSPILAALAELVSRWAEGAWVVAVDGLATQTGMLAREFRNPAAHTAVLTEADFRRCAALVQGENGLLAHLVRSTTP